MLAYLDSSAVLRHILSGDTAIHQAFAVGKVMASELLEIECHRTIQRYRMEGLFDDSQMATAVERLADFLGSIRILSLNSAVKRRAKGAFPVHVKTLDALHLATALVLEEREPDETILIYSYDATMNRCARVLGFGAPLAGEAALSCS